MMDEGGKRLKASFAAAQARLIQAVEDQGKADNEVLAPRIQGLKQGGMSLDDVLEIWAKALPPFDRDVPTPEDTIVAVYKKLNEDDRTIIVSKFLVDMFPADLSAAELKSATEGYIDKHGWEKIEHEAIMEQITFALQLISAPVPELKQ
jgi:exonuclease VII small subunit